MLHNLRYNMNHLARGKMIVLITVLVCSLICLNSCLYPEKFNITINITKDGKYTFVYDGFFIDDSTREANIKGQSPAEMKSAKEIEEYLHKITFFKEIKYVGEGKFKVLYQQEGDAKSGLFFIDKDTRWVSIEPVVSDIFMLSASNIDENVEKVSKKLNFVIAGTIVVTTNAKVLGHNARTAPKFFGFVGNYTWEIKSAADPAPKMLLQIP
jgi:hypothetical protein